METAWNACLKEKLTERKRPISRARKREASYITDPDMSCGVSVCAGLVVGLHKPSTLMIRVWQPSEAHLTRSGEWRRDISGIKEPDTSYPLVGPIVIRHHKSDTVVNQSRWQKVIMPSSSHFQYHSIVKAVVERRRRQETSFHQRILNDDRHLQLFWCTACYFTCICVLIMFVDSIVSNAFLSSLF